MKFNDILTETIKADLERGIVPALMGEPGIGKSSFVKDLAYSMGTRSFTLACNLLADKADLTGGRLLPTADKSSYNQVFFPHETIQAAIEYAKNNPHEWPILFLDEINRSTSDVTSASLGISTDRAVGSTPLPDNLRLMVAGNLKGNVTTLDEASLSRFAIYNVEPETTTFLGLHDDLNPWVKKVLTQFPAMIFQKATPNVLVADGDDDEDTASFADLFDSGEEMLQLTTPRTLKHLSDWLNQMTSEQLTRYLATSATVGDRETTVLNELVEAHVGNTPFATQLVSVISEDLASGTGKAVASRVTVPRPNRYADLKTASSVTDLENLIDDMSDNEKSGCLLFALSESSDNSRLIEQLAHGTHQIEKDHLRTLVELVSAQQVGQGNLTALMDSGAGIVTALSPILSAFQS